VLADMPSQVDAAELADYWPSGRKNPKHRGLGPWIRCYGQYCAFLRRALENKPAQGSQRAVAERAARDALRGAPEIFLDDAGKARTVHPKSWHALVTLASIQGRLLRSAQLFARLEGAPADVYAVHAPAVLEASDYFQRLAVWIVTHPEPGLPYPDSEPEPELPSWTLVLSPGDLVRAQECHHLVNGARIQLVTLLLHPAERPDDQGGDRTVGSWETLIALGAGELHMTARALARDVTLESVVTQLALTRDAQRQALEERERAAAAEEARRTAAQSRPAMEF